MKPNRFERNYRDTIPQNKVTTKSLSNATPMSRSAGKIGMSCDHCGMSYETYACWAKRVARHYCSKACSNAGKETPVEKECSICGTVFITTPSAACKHSTCSRKCLKEKRSIFLKQQARDMAHSSIYNYGDHERGSTISKKLDENQVNEILSDTRSQQKIAESYGVSQGAVSYIKQRITWAHVQSVETHNAAGVQ